MHKTNLTQRSRCPNYGNLQVSVDDNGIQHFHVQGNINLACFFINNIS